MRAWSGRIPKAVFDRLRAHLFQPGGGEHGAVLAAGVARSSRENRLLIREVFLAEEGTDYVPGNRGYRMLSAAFVRDRILHCRDEKLAYLAVHNHGGGESVAFSSIDLRSHERGYPALLDVVRGQPVGALVFATEAVAGDIWLGSDDRVSLEKLTIVGPALTSLYPKPRVSEHFGVPRYDRQSRLFGDIGQDILSRLKVGVIGAGGVGSLVIEYLARLGVGHLVVVDPDRIEETNLSRLVGARSSDARPSTGLLSRALGRRRTALTKVELARRLVQFANPSATFEGIRAEFQEATVAARFTDCDYLFLAADSMQARYLFNAMVQQYLIPGYQVGSKALVEATSGKLTDVYSVVRPILPGDGCLWCNGLITPSRLQEESASPEERAVQGYVDDPAVPAPSVITLNALAAGQAANDFLFSAVGLLQSSVPQDYMTFRPIRRDVRFERPRRDDDCPECSPIGRLGRGDSVRLPTHQ